MCFFMLCFLCFIICVFSSVFRIVFYVLGCALYHDLDLVRLSQTSLFLFFNSSVSCSIVCAAGIYDCKVERVE